MVHKTPLEHILFHLKQPYQSYQGENYHTRWKRNYLHDGTYINNIVYTNDNI